MTEPLVRADATAAWAALRGHFEAHGRGFDLRDAFAADPGRFERFSLAAPEVFTDLSKQRIDAATLAFLRDLARECGVEARRDAMLRGAAINTTEGRAVLHTALRAPAGAAPFSADVHDTLAAMLAYADEVRSRADRGELVHVVHIGIGGSDLGPRMAVTALAPFAHPGLDMRFVANVDPHEIAAALHGLDAAKTLVVVASKTFTTQETMANAASAKAWFEAGARGAPVERHFAATTTNVGAAAAFGITRNFGFWDWVGGRYSLWSAIGLPVAIAIGANAFRELLAGARAMDEHFAREPLERNVPVTLGLVDVWNRNFHGWASRCVAPYHHGLARFPAYLQQLEMESNGKRVDRDGRLLPYATSPVVWGEPGTNAQHAYFQLLHQGTDVVPVDFILVREPRFAPGERSAALAAALARQHRMLLANGLAQSQALMQGRAAADGARDFPGNRPSTTIVVDALAPRALGALVALHEHRVFTSGAIWGINSFDQFGVELGKSLANTLLADLVPGSAEAAPALDSSTAGLLARIRR